MTITTTELLSFLCKAQKLSITSIAYTQTDEGYKITLCTDWYDDGGWFDKTVFITNEGESTWEKGDYDFHTMSGILDEMLEEQAQRKLKEEKRKELIARLTDEERELLGVGN